MRIRSTTLAAALVLSALAFSLPTFAASGSGSGGSGSGSSGGGGGGGGGASVRRIVMALVSTGADADASGKLDFRRKAARRGRVVTRFNVEAEDLDPANYDVVVGGVVRGVLDVRVQPDGSVEGELEFRRPVEPGKRLLSFDPRGQLVSVERAGTVYLQAVLPAN